MSTPANTLTERISILIDGTSVECEPGASVASVLLASDHIVFSSHPVDSSPRGPFCMMGACQSCRVSIDGQWRLACQVLVRQDLSVQLRINTA